MKILKYKIGDKIKLKDYVGFGNKIGFNGTEGWSDWQEHSGQIAEIEGFSTMRHAMDYRIRWADGRTSAVPEHNVVLYGAPLLSIQEYLNQYKR